MSSFMYLNIVSKGGEKAEKRRARGLSAINQEDLKLIGTTFTYIYATSSMRYMAEVAVTSSPLSEFLVTYTPSCLL